MAVLYLDRASIESLTERDIREILDRNIPKIRYRKLHDYYLGEHRILSDWKKDSTVPNNHIVTNMAKYITDTATAYFVGQPVVYASDNNEYLSILQDIFDYNDEQDENTEIAKEASISGSCFEMLYMDEDLRVRFARVPPANGIMLCETDSGFSQPLAFLRTVLSRDKNDNIIRKVEFWNRFRVMRFRSINGGYLEMTGVQEHYWQDIPFIEYINNEERIGDFEGVISMIDAYNKAESNTANYFQYNDDAILKVMKLGDVSSQDIRDMKEKGAIILEDGGDVGWLLKTIDDTALENYKNRLREDIHTMANVPNMTDDSFGGNLSGVAISYKIWGLEQMCAIKQRKFKKALQRRVELITNMLNVMGHSFDYRDITPKFRRNRPENDLETAQIVTMLSNDLSRETRLQMIPQVEDVQSEIKKLEAEKSREEENFGVYQNFAKAFQTDAEDKDGTSGEK